MGENIRQDLNGISVVIPSHGREKLVQQLLLSIKNARQRIDVDSEILVVDSSNGSDAGLIKGYCQELGCKYIVCENNVAKKRNLGTSLSQYPIILFMDSDCEVDSNLLAEHLRCYCQVINGQPGGVLGVTEFRGHKNLVWEIVESTIFVAAYSLAKYAKTVQFTVGTNISFRREVLLETGGYDIAFPNRVGGEDVDLGLRLTEAGYIIHCCPEAVAYHTTETWNHWRNLIERFFLWGRGQYHVMKRHPDQAQYDNPTLTFLFLMFLLLAAVKSFIEHSLFPLSLPFIWWLLAFTFQGMFQFWGKTNKGKLMKIVYGGDLLYTTYELGQIVEALKNLDIKGCILRFTPPANTNTSKHTPGARRNWSALLALFIVFILL